MRSLTRTDNHLPLQMLVLAAIVVTASFVWQGSKGLNLWDEGFLWYGAQRVLLGEVPIRDFMAYDPGRYYWIAGLMSLWGGNGLMVLRIAAAIFQVLGLFVGLLLVARTEKDCGKQNICYLLLSAAILVVWMFPPHKLFDISLSLFLIGVLTFLIQGPTSRRYFVSGLVVGLIAVFGRNHGLYGLAGTLGFFVWSSLDQTNQGGLLKGIAMWSVGVVIGYIPILLMASLVPGFAIAFWDSIRFLFEIKATNLARPIPWPWRVDFTSPLSGEAIRGVLMGFAFIGTVVFGVLAMFWVVRQKLQRKPVSPALAASSFLALPYAHYAFSRADIHHLALGIFPFLIGCLLLLSAQPAKLKWPFALLLGVASIFVVYPIHPGWQCRASMQCVNVEISGSNFQVDPLTADDISLLRRLAGKYASDGQSFVATPFWPGAYALLQRKSPMWEIYALFPRQQGFERAEIERIRTAMPKFAIVLDLPLDGRDELRFRNTHPLIHRYILDNFDRLPKSSNPAYQVYTAKEGVF